MEVESAHILDYRGSRVPVSRERPIVVGTASDCDLLLPSASGGAKHARFVVDGDGLSVEALSSRRAVFVNGDRVERARLKRGDRVLLGVSIVKVAATTSGADPPAAA